MIRKISIGRTLRTALLLAAASSPALAQPLAFPSAEGFGRYAKGGRGGAVFQVTNLLDSGPGSLRACVDATGPRTCVFTVSGDIFLQSELLIDDPFLTVAGQTAPGQGIQLRHANNTRNGFSVSTHDVIIRHMKIRLGPTLQTSDIPNCIQVLPRGGVVPADIVLDHISCAWATDQLIAISPDSDRITISDSLFYEGLNRSTHVQGNHSKGPNFRSCGVSTVRTLMANSVIRNPNNTCGLDDPNRTILRSTTGGIAGENEFRNNLVFNGQEAFLDYWNGRGESWLNLVGNVFVRGPSTKNKLNGKIPHGVYAVDAWDQTSRDVRSGTTDPQHLCLQDNIGIGLPTNTDGGAAIHGVLNPNDAHLVESTNCVSNPVGRPGATRGITGPVLPSGAVEASVLSGSGALPWNRDAADARIVSDVASRRGAIIDHPSEVGGWPVMTKGTAPADTDRDGMPDAWEIAQGLKANDAADRNADQDGDAFTNLEEYLAEAARDQTGMGGNAPPPPPPPPTPNPNPTPPPPPPPPPGPTNPPAPSGPVRVGAQIALTTNAAVHETVSARRSGVQKSGATGAVVAGPTTFKGNLWWQVDFASGVDGWVRASAVRAQ
ncbi:MAG: hypothetical protein U5J99_04915 [Parvularculaceae bacterium]|nr:hypothetical protein [Parvularculaceae bacterium]